MTSVGNKVKISITIDPDVHGAVEAARGLVPLSTYLNDLLKDHYHLT